MIVRVHRAENAPDLTEVYIGSDVFLPRGGANWQEDNREIFEFEAELIVRALHQSLPGGTFDALLRMMLERRASQLVVADHPKEESDDRVLLRRAFDIIHDEANRPVEKGEFWPAGWRQTYQQLCALFLPEGER